jgi:uncharacterized protein
MWHLPREAVHRWLQKLLHTHDSPERTALAIGLGVAIGFSPFLGFHVLLGILLAFIFNFNRVAVIAGTWVNLPWLMAPYYAAATAAGSWLLGAPIPPHLVEHIEQSWELPNWGLRLDAFARLLEPLVWPFTLGSLLGAIVAGFVAFHLVKPVLVVLHRRHLASVARARTSADKPLKQQ